MPWFNWNYISPSLARKTGEYGYRIHAPTFYLHDLLQELSQVSLKIIGLITFFFLCQKAPIWHQYRDKIVAMQSFSHS